MSATSITMDTEGAGHNGAAIPGPATQFTSRHLRRAMLGAALMVAATAVHAQNGDVPVPGFFKSFSPDTIGPGSVSTLTFTIDNAESPYPVDNLAFTDMLPAEMTIATPANASNNCGGTLSAPDGGGTISLSGGGVGAFSACAINVDVTSSSVGGGPHTNVSGELTSDAGNSGPATADLTVDDTLPGFTKAFDPSSVALGSRSTLTFTIDNGGSEGSRSNLTFTDNLPSGLVVASPANVVNTCGGVTIGNLTIGPGVVAAVPGSNVVSLTPAVGFDLGAVDAFATCAVSVDVIAGGGGALGNTSGELTSAPSLGGAVSSSGKAGAVLEVTVDALALIKSFPDDPVPPGGTATLEFQITNFDRSETATGIAFSDDLDATLSGLTATGATTNTCGGMGSGFPTSLFAYTGGNLGPGESCTIVLTLQVPAGAAPGAYTNTTSSITADIGGASVTGSPGSDDLFVQAAPLLTKEFTDDPVGPGGTVILEFTIENTSTTASATDIAFDDVFPVVLPTAGATPGDDFCNGTGTSTFTPLLEFSNAQLIVSDVVLAPGASCSFDITLDVAVGAPGGTYPNTTSAITATLDNETVTGNPASDNLVVVRSPRFTKTFTDDPVLPGDTATLEFTISYGDEGTIGDATSIMFTDNLDAALSGLTAVGLPLTDPCGAGSELTGTTNLSLTGGTLTPGTSCTFTVPVQVPIVALPGNYTNTTSELTANVLGVATTGAPAQDDLMVAGLSLSKEFTDDPVIAGGTVTLEFTLTNSSPSQDATSIFFTDNLDDTLAGLTANLPPNPDPPCGVGSSLAGSFGDTLLTFSSGSLAAGTSCTFSVTLQVPALAASGSYSNTTSNLIAGVGGSTVVLDPAVDRLFVSSDLLSLIKEFTDDPATPGGTVNLRFTLTNLDPSQAASGIAFTDDLDAALTGLVAVGLPTAACGGTVSGTGLLMLTGGSLTAGESCSFDVTLSVPPDVPLGTVATNTTSDVTGTIGGLGVRGDPASDVLRIDFLSLGKAFDGPAVPGGTVVLSFTIDNLDGSNGVADLEFTDNLDLVIPGLVATGLPVSDVCGTGSVFDGTSLLSLSGGNLGPGGSCTFDVTLQVPGGATSGIYPNTTSTLRQAGNPAAVPATADLVIIGPAIDIEKTPDAQAILFGDTAGFTIEVTNTGDTDLTNVIVADPLVPDCNRVIGNLAQGASISYACELTGATADFTNTAEVTADTPLPAVQVSDVDTADVTVEVPPPFRNLTVTVEGNGTVLSVPRGILCPTGCSSDFRTGSKVLLIAWPRRGWVFDGWSGGGCSGALPICAVTMDTDQAVTARFVPRTVFMSLWLWLIR